MKTSLAPAVKSRPAPPANSALAELERKVIAASLDAIHHVEDATQKCLRAGQLMNELKDALPHGDFMTWRKANLPQISDDTAERWRRAAANVLKALPPVQGVIDVESIPLSEILTTPADELPKAAREWRQQWFSFVEDKTIKDCLEAVCVEGDSAIRADRAINGKTKGGSGGDRKDFPLFVAVKLKDMGAHFSHWSGMTETQRTEAKSALVAAITGEAMTLRKRTFNFAIWPDEVCDVAMEALKSRLKGRKQ